MLVPDDGGRISTVDYRPRQWFKTCVPSTVLTALVKNGVYPDPRIGLNCYQIPDASDEFNRKHDLAKFSYLPDKRNPWRDPYWYRTEFTLPKLPPGAARLAELRLDQLSRRGVAQRRSRSPTSDTMAGMFQRFRFDITGTSGPDAMRWPSRSTGGPSGHTRQATGGRSGLTAASTRRSSGRHRDR